MNSGDLTLLLPKSFFFSIPKTFKNQCTQNNIFLMKKVKCDYLKINPHIPTVIKELSELLKDDPK